MAHVIHSINTTLSGSCYHLDSVTGDEHHAYATELTASADALVFGRNTFDLFMQFWPMALSRTDLPASTVALARVLARIPKLVVSSRPVELSWNNTRHVPGPDLARLKDELLQLNGRAVIFGSPGLSASLLNDGMVNELHVLVQPYIGVKGPQMYSGLLERAALALVDVRSLQEGSVLLRYNLTCNQSVA
ncbi:dihydrofolate reductase family protein [Aliidiomarina sp. Khilg15.8]